MSAITVTTLAIREYPGEYLIRYEIETERFAQVLSSVTSRSVVLVGVVREETRKETGTEVPYSLIAIIPLTASVNPDQTRAILEGNDLLLRLVKCEKPESEEAHCRLPSLASCGCE